MDEPRIPPATRYQGSKRKLLGWIDEKLGDRQISSLFDLMSGTSSVAYHFKDKGYRVGVNDYLRCNYLTGVALIENNRTQLSHDDIEWILTKPTQANGYDFIQRNFRGFFFNTRENRWLDERIAQIEGLRERYSGDQLRHKQAIALRALFQAALMKRPFNLFHRKNLYLRTNTAERSFGNKTTWDTPSPISSDA